MKNRDIIGTVVLPWLVGNLRATTQDEQGNHYSYSQKHDEKQSIQNLCQIHPASCDIIMRYISMVIISRFCLDEDWCGCCNLIDINIHGIILCDYIFVF